MLKNIKWSSLIMAAVYIVAGVLLVIYPQLSEELICDVIEIGRAHV